MNSQQPDVEAKGREIFSRMHGERPTVFSRRKLTGWLMRWSMRNERLKTQLFRLVDVLPALGTSQEIAGHARDYLAGPGESGSAGAPAGRRVVASERGRSSGSDGEGSALSGWMRWAVRFAPRVSWLTALAARRSVAEMADTFILARNGAEAAPKLRAMRKLPMAFTVDILGETVVSDTEACQYQARYLELIESLSRHAEQWPLVGQIDCNDRGQIPRVNVSVKVSALDPLILKTDPEGAIQRLSDRLRPLLMAAKACGVFINFDMEQSELKDLTLALFKRLLGERELREYDRAGIALQAYLLETERDLRDLIAWAKAGNRRITIRLIKGAYWDYETILAGQRGWPAPVFQTKAETDANFERLAGLMLDHERWIDCAFGTHSIRTIASCIVQAEKRSLTRNQYEFQMLYGMAEPIKRALVRMGHRVREYCPIGEVLPGMSYLVRRLLENSSNEGFLRATFSEHASLEELLRDPEEVVAEAEGESVRAEVEGEGESVRAVERERRAAVEGESVRAVERKSGARRGEKIERRRRRGEDERADADESERQFENEPHTDFTKSGNREQMARALASVHAELGRSYPLVIGGQEIKTASEIVSINPARPSEIIGRVARSGKEEAEQAVAAAERAFPAWRATPVEERARLLESAADLIREERFRIAALEVYETGKVWVEADADVAEAIDFCRFYAAEMRRIASSEYVVPGERNVHHYIPRGTAVIIAPWNFPLAILCGMTTAALVTGNCAIIKPSEQSPVVAARFVDILRRAGFPKGVVNFVPGRGSEVGAQLADHPRTAIVAFTGSREVGLKIWEAAGRTRPGQVQLKKVICEMGGKNALVIDSDADLDEAIPAVLASAFGYQGQKCSALSRLIVLAENSDLVLKRLAEGARRLPIGMPEHPGTVIGPVIDLEAYERIHQYIDLGKREARLAFQADVPLAEGYFVGPTIFKDVAPEARIAQEEIFGPVLCVLQAGDLGEAIRWANSSQYALTGGFYSRSPANIERVKAEFEVGNLYINRGITGALVARHPFGGFKMSGGGTKAGGRDYLQQFLFPRTITENQMRRGFAPPPPADGASASA